MSKPRLSFIVPIYKPDLDLLGRCIKSLATQSLKEWELIAVLDGPDEGARAVIRSGMKKCANDFKIVEQPHAGVQKARNLGQEHARGEFLVHWDCDSLIEVDTAKTWVAMFDKYPEKAFVYSGYKFLNEQGAIDSEPFDPWLLKVRNYISTCFPVRREYCAKWNESLKSLQDWDFWLSVVEKGGKGHFLPGHAFSTAYPEPKSISGQGCTNEVWLSRIDAVKKLHNLPERSVCVSALGKKLDGISLAKTLYADYQDYPNWKPHRYKTIIQLGFSFLPGRVEDHVAIFNESAVKKVIFWTPDDISLAFTRLNYLAIKKYRTLLNAMPNLSMFVEDKEAHDRMTELGFKVEIRPLPMVAAEVKPLPEKPKFMVDIDPNYHPVFEILHKSLPDVELVLNQGAARITDFTGLCHFYPDKTTSVSMKRAHLAGRHVISNVQAPFNGFVDDGQDLDKFIPQAVEAIRAAAYAPQPTSGRDYYIKNSDPKAFAEVFK